MAETVDSTVNPQASAPGQVEPQRTPGSAPDVAPLPAGAAPSSSKEHPLPEEVISGYPKVAKLEAEKAAGKSDAGTAAVSPSPTPKAADRK
jgi:hypothetical protein